jgi:hypothetical protein
MMPLVARAGNVAQGMQHEAARERKMRLPQLYCVKA